MSKPKPKTAIPRPHCIRLSLEFYGAVLPIIQDEHGHDVVPLKPIVEIFGLDWESQRRKLNNGLRRRLGTCIAAYPQRGTGDIPGTLNGQEMVCIRLSRVAAYLNTINPEKVRSHGNDSGAYFLEQKQEEWDDVVHAYELGNGIFASARQREVSTHSRQIRDFIAVNREKRCTD